MSMLSNYSIVIPYKKTNSDELEWAIKSLSNINHNKIYVIKDDHEIEQWGKLNPYLNQIAKYHYACMNLSLTDTFIASNDDIFIMQNWNYINYNQGLLEDHINRRKTKDVYTRSLINTKNWLEEQGKTTLSFELHTPFLFNTLKLIFLINIIPKDKPIQIRSLYGNYYGVETEFIEDVKNPKNPEGMPIISTDNRTFKGELGKYIRDNL